MAAAMRVCHPCGTAREAPTLPISAAETALKGPPPWEIEYLRDTRNLIMSNTFTQIEEVVTRLSAQGTRFEFECYDTGHLYTLAHFADAGLIKPPSTGAGGAVSASALVATRTKRRAR